MGSSIYIAGGFRNKLPPSSDRWHPFRNVLTVDTAHLSDRDWPSSWNVIRPRPRNARFMPKDVVSVDGILYVMGGLDHEFGDEEKWAEAFKPELRKWVSIPPPLPAHRFPFVSIVVGFNCVV